MRRSFRRLILLSALALLGTTTGCVTWFQDTVQDDASGQHLVFGFRGDSVHVWALENGELHDVEVEVTNR